MYPQLMGMMRGDFSGAPTRRMGMGSGPMGAMGGGGLGGSGFGGMSGNFGPGMMVLGGARQMPRAARTPKMPDAPIKLELRPGFITDITLAEEASLADSGETPEPSVTVEKTLDPLEEEDPINAKYWKGMPPKQEKKKGL